jgi:Ran GTPase-activating protein (RanGAP) involved in mRNA processing and transport
VAGNLQGVGDDYMIMLSKALVYMPHLRHLDVSDNRLTDKSLQHLLE